MTIAETLSATSSSTMATCCSIEVSWAPVRTTRSAPSASAASRAPCSIFTKKGLVSVFITRATRGTTVTASGAAAGSADSPAGVGASSQPASASASSATPTVRRVMRPETPATVEMAPASVMATDPGGPRHGWSRPAASMHPGTRGATPAHEVRTGSL
jgi:hypothetical protein